MKHFKLLTILIITFVWTTLHAQTNRYEVKSGSVEYSITHSGNMMGMSMQGKGTAKTIFKEWGNVELHSEEINSVTMGMKKSQKQMTKIDNGKVYSVDFDQNVIYEFSADTLMNSEYKDLVKTGKDALTSMGGKKVGEENFLGYDCEIWEMMQVKIWLHKGVMLKSEANIMGIKNTTVATKVELNNAISDDAFKLPNFPVKKGKREGNMPQMTPEQMQQMQEMMKSFTQR